MTFRFTSNAEEFNRAVKNAGDKLPKAAKKGLQQMTEEWVSRMKKQQFTGYYPGPTRGRKLRTRSGALRSSVGGRVLGKKLSSLRSVLRVGGGRVGRKGGYGPLQEFGSKGRIRAKSPRKMLSIPLPAARTAAGVLKAAAKIKPKGEGYEAGGRPIFMFISKRGNPLLAVKKGKKGKIQPLYSLKESVKVRGRLHARDKLKRVVKEHRPVMTERLLRVLVEARG